MQLSVIPHVQPTAVTKPVQGKSVVVFDVFRATSSIVTALAHGAKQIIPVASIEEAKAKKQAEVLLAGERYGKKIPGFDLGNSPSEFTTPLIHNRTLVLTTTNGTKAIHQAKEAAHLLIGSLLNAEACSQKVAELNQDVVLFCSGTMGQFSFEDAIGAGAVISYLKQKVPSLVCDELGELIYHSFFAVLKADFIPLRHHPSTELSHEDRADCLKLNHYPIVPMFDRGKIRLES